MPLLHFLFWIRPCKTSNPVCYWFYINSWLIYHASFWSIFLIEEWKYWNYNEFSMIFENCIFSNLCFCTWNLLPNAIYNISYNWLEWDFLIMKFWFHFACLFPHIARLNSWCSMIWKKLYGMYLLKLFQCFVFAILTAYFCIF